MAKVGFKSTFAPKYQHREDFFCHDAEFIKDRTKAGFGEKTQKKVLKRNSHMINFLVILASIP
jgi:hypothetical protein